MIRIGILGAGTMGAVHAGTYAGMPPTEIPIAGRNPYEAELRRFVDCIGGNADPAFLDADRAIEALDLSLATQRALAGGQPVTL